VDSHINIFDTHGIFHKDFPLNGVVILWIHQFLINILAVDIFSEEISKFLSSETRREHNSVPVFLPNGDRAVKDVCVRV
jgi:hypothetical protein